MQRMLLVKNDELDEVNMFLSKGAKIVGIYPVAEAIDVNSNYGGRPNGLQIYAGNVYAYVVIEEYVANDGFGR